MIDYALIAMMILPIVACIVLKVLYTPASEGVHISGAMVYLQFPAPVMDAYISESQVNSWAVMIRLIGCVALCALLIAVFKTDVYATLIPMLFPQIGVFFRALGSRKRGAEAPGTEGDDLID
jgi:hypothetical protein